MPEIKKARRMLWLFGLLKIPLIGYVRPRLVEITEARMVIKIPLRRRTRNHLGSMYFGALAIGADLAGAFQAFQVADDMGRKMSIVFKDFKANFIKRPESDVFFMAADGLLIKEMLTETMATGERVTKEIKIKALTGYPDNPEVVAEFALGLSVKDKARAPVQSTQ